jgi:hypothetical protein
MSQDVLSGPFSELAPERDIAYEADDLVRVVGDELVWRFQTHLDSRPWLNDLAGTVCIRHDHGAAAAHRLQNGYSVGLDRRHAKDVGGLVHRDEVLARNLFKKRQRVRQSQVGGKLSARALIGGKSPANDRQLKLGSSQGNCGRPQEQFDAFVRHESTDEKKLRRFGQASTRWWGESIMLDTRVG